MFRILSKIATVVLFFVGQVAHAERPVVVELFTSQGCSSCPPADVLLEKYAARADVIALAYHVDYWDYLGWKDVFASPEFTQRQRNYARARNESKIYTPQFVVNGAVPIVGARSSALQSTVGSEARSAEPVTLAVQRVGGDLRITMSPNAGSVGAAEVIAVTVIPQETVTINRGENAGRRLRYNNIVTDITVLGRWDGRSGATLKTALPRGRTAILIQAQGYGPVLAARWAN